MIYFMDIESLSKQLEVISYFLKVICTLYFNLKNDISKSILVTAYPEGITFFEAIVCYQNIIGVEDKTFSAKFLTLLRRVSVLN